MKITSEKILFDPKLQAEIKDRFYYVNEDYLGRKRQFFENSGGSLRLKAAVEAKARLEQIPDCPERIHDTSLMLKQVKADGIKDIMEVIFGANPGEGALVTELTASQCMFQVVRTILENVPGTNAVTTSIEHPSAHDATEQYCLRTGKEFRVAMANANLLQIIVFTLFLGVALLALGERASAVTKVIDQGAEIMLKITEYVIGFSPIGIMSLIATMVTTISGAMMKEVIKFIILDNVTGLILLILLPIIASLVGKVNLGRLVKKIMPAVLVAASTSSSAATLPVSMKICDEELGIPENIYGFTLPLGNTCGMIGFATFIGMCCIFASNLYGFDVTFASVLQFVFLGLILSIGAAGVKGAGVVMSSVLLSSLGMPLTLIPILAAIWPTIDPIHTTLNNVGDITGTIIVSRSLDKMDMEVFNK